MKRKVRLSALIVLAVLMLSLLIGGLYGYFDDTETSTGNVFTAGTLNLVATDNGTGPAGKYIVTPGGDGINGKVVFDRIAPGDNGTITWTLTNNGNLNGTLTMASTVTFAENGSNEPEAAAIVANGGTDLGLGERVGVKLQCNGAYILGNAGTWGSFANLQSTLNAESQSLVAAGTITYVFTWNIDSSVGNIIQGDTANIDVTFTLDQTH
jgi:predicted ribosomally synthesized peptide with SipW-like signal peptide